MRNADVLKLKQAGISEQVMIETITSAAVVSFELDATHVIELHDAGVPDGVIQAMLRRNQR
jgi:hypothetical protein